MICFHIRDVSDCQLRDLYDALYRSELDTWTYEDRHEPGHWWIVVKGRDREKVVKALNARQFQALEWHVDKPTEKQIDAYIMQADIAYLSQKAALIALGVEDKRSLGALQSTLVKFIQSHQKEVATDDASPPRQD